MLFVYHGEAGQQTRAEREFVYIEENFEKGAGQERPWELTRHMEKGGGEHREPG